MIKLPYQSEYDVVKAATFIAELKRQGIEFAAEVDGTVMRIELHGH